MIRPLLAAFTLLTVVPAGKFCPSTDEVRRSITFFPLVGLALGALFYGIGLIVGDNFTAIALLTLLPECCTKGFHLDGLADTADGFLSGRDRARKLEIMRDSRIGTMGVLAVVALLLAKFAALRDLEAAGLAAGLMLLNGRVGVLFHIATSRYARPDGLGKIWFEGPKPWTGMALGLALAFGLGWRFAGTAGLAAAGAAVIFPMLWIVVTRHVIGGATGDTVGACEEMTELVTLWVLLARPF